MSNKLAKILYLEDEDKFAKSFTFYALKHKMDLIRVKYGAEFVARAESEDFDGFIMDAKGLWDRNQKEENTDAMASIYDALNKLRNVKPYITVTAYKDRIARGVFDHKNRGKTFTKNDNVQEAFDYLNKEIKDSSGWVFKVKNYELYEALNSFVTKPEDKNKYKELFMNVGPEKDYPVEDIENTVAGFKRIFENILEETGNILKKNYKDPSMLNMPDLKNKLEYMKNQKSFPLPQHMFDLMCSVKQLFNDCGHYNEGRPQKFYLDGIVLHTANILVWFGNNVIKQSDRG